MKRVFFNKFRKSPFIYIAAMLHHYKGSEWTNL